ncbi:16S rRNA (guanine(527)-N(7))-methyltransferase RsmG [Candidatus Vallotia tarda]|uniref:Ribosomal RNA small subunit methyltransferase G n=1 Tax=Candidatus Vallotiella hemipterorum TaxID=1177213 RepID=A0A916JUN0_9BURK|nr:16S rRNA (guanine(527)-N(7))-methyltransferase RsmG [Candidatus Vallotia tarda]CAG7604081.1 Ribosomal RNA small subunit methyltransferase G [Candidatus Vallotia tarda]
MIYTRDSRVQGAHKDFSTQRIELKKLLWDGAAKLGVLLSAEQISGLLDYIALLSKWNVVYNLTAICNPRQMVIRHLLDSLAIVPYIAARSPASLLDVGSGNGLPGIVIAFAMPCCTVVNNDIVQKKTAFQQQAKGFLRLSNLSIVTGRVEQLHIGTNILPQFDAIVSRAFSELANFVALTRHLLAPGGVLWAMKGVYPDKEITKLPDDVIVRQVIRLTVPSLDAERHILEIAIKPECIGY